MALGLSTRRLVPIFHHTNVSGLVKLTALSVRHVKCNINRQGLARTSTRLAFSRSTQSLQQTRMISSMSSIYAPRMKENDMPVMADKVDTVPQFVMPVEGGDHAFTMMVFPSIDSALDHDHLERMQTEVMSIANTIAKYESVHVYARKELVNRAQAMAQSNVVVREAPVNELWVRDSGPVHVTNQSTGQQTAIKFNFSYWGGKLPLKGDEVAADHIAEIEKISSFKSKLVLEGGAIEHDGDGTFLGAESCILNDNRNPNKSKAEIQSELTAMLGVQKFIWVPGVKGFDITDCHIDALARFIEPGVVLLSKPAPNGPPPMIKAYTEARDAISKSTDAKGRSITIHDCEEPDLEIMGASADEANVVIASYANFYLVNGAVIIPQFGQSGPDQAALELFRKLFPPREVVQVYINILPRTGGGIHCATQQVPV